MQTESLSLENPKSEKEIREEQSKKVIEFLDKSHAFEYFKKLLSEEDIEKPDFDSFKDFLIRINGIARNIPIHERYIDGENVHIAGYVDTDEVLRHEDKEDVLRNGYEKILNLHNHQDIKYVLPALINAVHLFMDGNGRTSRIIHLLLSDHSTKEEFLIETEKALGVDGRYNSLDINPGFIKSELRKIILKKHGWNFDDEVPQCLGLIKNGINGSERTGDQAYKTNKDAKKVFDLYSDESLYILTAINMLLGDEGIKNVTGEFDMISPIKMFEILKPEDWVQILDNFYILKKEQAELLVDIFVEPEKYKVSDNDTKTVKDLFIEKIKTQRWTELVHIVDEFSKEDPIPMDEGIKESVVSLMAHGFRTKASCFGHLDEEDSKPYPWIAIRGDAAVDALFDDERIQENNTRYFDEAIEGKELLTQDERNEIEQLQNRIRVSKENERQRLLCFLAEFYSTRVVEPGIKLTVSPFIGWLCSSEVVDADRDEVKDETPVVELEAKLERYREEMIAFTQFMKNKFFKQ